MLLIGLSYQFVFYYCACSIAREANSAFNYGTNYKYSFACSLLPQTSIVPQSLMFSRVIANQSSSLRLVHLRKSP